MIATSLLAITLLVGVMFTPSNRLVVRSDGGQNIVCERISSGDRVTLTFTNSMFGGAVRETYLVNSDQLTQVSFVTELEAAAEYYAWTLPVLQTNDGFQVLVEPESYSSIPVQVDPRSDYKLTIGNSTFDLSGEVEQPMSVVIELQISSLISTWISGC